METLSIEEEVKEEEEEVEGRREWLQGRQTERPERGFARGIDQDNIVRPNNQPP